MCGIAGLWALNGADPDLDDLRRMLTAMQHRGPEGATYARVEGSLLLGFLALGFTDAPTSFQPLFNEDYTIALVYNGEIYDYEAERDALRAKGHHFRTRSDSEVLIHAYEEYGLDFVNRLNGEFSFVLYDGRVGELIAVRDRFGVKPLYTCWSQGVFAFASEAKALLAIQSVERRFDPVWFTGPGMGIPETSLTPFRGITQVRPGQMLRLSRAGCRTERWWTPSFAKVERSFDEAASAVRRELKAAVRRRVSGNVPIALSLSSGLDSTVVGALIADERSDVPAFSMAYPGAAYDESAQAARTAAHLGMVLEPVPCGIDDLADGFLDSIWSTEIATNSLSTAARLRLTKAVRGAGYKALIGGEGSDELFGGYPYFGLEAIWRLRGSDDPSDRARGDAAYAEFRTRELLSEGVFWDDTEAWRSTPSSWGPPNVVHLRAHTTERLSRLVLSRRARRELGSATHTAALDTELDPRLLRTLHPFDATRMVSRSVVSSFPMPALGDRVEMRNSLEGRAPFLDANVVALAHTLPQEHCIDPASWRRKHVLRAAFADRLPPVFEPLPKHTLMAPSFAELHRTATGRQLFALLLSDRALRRTGLFRRAFVHALLAAWRVWPRSDARFARIDGLVGWVLSVQALHHVFVDRPAQHGHHTPLLALRDQSPPAAQRRLRRA